MGIEQVPANRRLVEELHAYGYLTATAREAALEFLKPRDQWSPDSADRGRYLLVGLADGDRIPIEP